MLAKKILILGATGRTAKYAIPMALVKHYKIVALVRDPEKITFQSESLTVIKGLPTDIADVRKAMHDCDAVLSFLGPLSRGQAISFRKIKRPHILKKSIANVLEVMKEYGIKRIMILSTLGAGDSWRFNPWYVKLLGRFTNFKVIFEDHTAQEKLVQNSETDWTIARAARLSDKLTSGKLIISYHRSPKPFHISRQLLAEFFIENIYNEAYRQKAPILSEAGKN